MNPAFALIIDTDVVMLNASMCLGYWGGGCAVRASAKPVRKTGSVGCVNKGKSWDSNARGHVELMGHSPPSTPFLHSTRPSAWTIFPFLLPEDRRVFVARLA